MDNNPTPAQGSIPVQPAMQTQLQSNVTQTTPSGGNKMMLWIILGLILTILVVGGAYWYLSNQQPKTEELTSNSQPLKQGEDNLESDLDLIVVPEVDANFAEVDKDLGSL